jgi:hypothetical protein
MRQHTRYKATQDIKKEENNFNMCVFKYLRLWKRGGRLSDCRER